MSESERRPISRAMVYVSGQLPLCGGHYDHEVVGILRRAAQAHQLTLLVDEAGVDPSELKIYGLQDPAPRATSRIRCSVLQSRIRGLGAPEPAVFPQICSCGQHERRFCTEKAIACLESGQMVILDTGVGVPGVPALLTAAMLVRPLGAEVLLIMSDRWGIAPPGGALATTLAYSRATQIEPQTVDPLTAAFCAAQGVLGQILRPRDLEKFLAGETVGTSLTPEG